MYGMTEKEFWEDDPQLYWSYHIFYSKKQKEDIEQMKYRAWLYGNMNYIAHSCSLSDGFAKEGTSPKGYPEYKNIFNNKSTQKTEEEKNQIITQENNFWARF